MKLNFKSYGETGATIIILHGLFGMLDNWQTIAKVLAKNGYKVYLLDLRNHGKSPHTYDFDYYLLTDDLLGFCEEHSLEKIHLIGHSMGGKVAMQFAVENEEKIDKLIIVDIAPKDYPAGHESVFDAFFAVPLKELSSRKEAADIIRQHISEEGLVQFLLKNLSRNKAGQYRWKANIESIYQHYENITTNSLHLQDCFEGESLFIKGGSSERYIMPEDDWPTILHHFPNALLQIVEDAGHWVHAEKPVLTTKIILDFLGSNKK